jgi:hypothetical protein
MAIHAARFVHLFVAFQLVSGSFAIAASEGDRPAGADVDPGRVALEAGNARIRAERLEIEKSSKTLGGDWRQADSVEWDFRLDRAGWYQVIVHYALPADLLKGTASWKAVVGDQTRLGPIHATGSNNRFLPQVLFDPIELKAGEHRLNLAIRSESAVADLKVRKVELVRAREPGQP